MTRYVRLALMPLGAMFVACAPADSDIAPDVAARALKAATAPVAFLGTDDEALVIAAGEKVRLAAVPYDASGSPLTDRTITFRALDTTIVQVGRSGDVLGRRTGRAAVIAASGSAADTIPLAVAAAGERSAHVEIFPSRTFQHMEGWEAHHQSGEIDCNPANFALYRDELFDRAVNELGINRLRLEVRSGMEAPDLRAPGGNEAQSTAVKFGTPWFSPKNDNDDPFVADSAGFQFDWFDYNIENSILPIRDRLAKRGERLYLNLTYVDFFQSTPYEQMQDPEEYAELIAVTFDHMQRRFGFVPDAVEVMLEPDNTPWTPEQIARGMVAAGDRLKAAGFHPEFIAPSTTNLAEAVRSYDRMKRIPRVGEYLKVLSYHRYSGVSRAALRELTLRARRDGLRLAMLEHADGSAGELHDDLTLGHVGAWERFALAFCGANANPDAGGVYYQVQLTRGAAPRVILTNAARLLRHYFAFVRQGAVRVAAASSDNDFSPAAFRNENGSYVVVLRTSRGGDFSLGGLPDGDYTVLWSLEGSDRSESRSIAVKGSPLIGQIPGAGFVTIYAH